MADLVLTLDHEYKQLENLIKRIPPYINEPVKDYFIEEIKKKGETLNLIIDKSILANIKLIPLSFSQKMQGDVRIDQPDKGGALKECIETQLIE